jgi:hypothetical protein
MSLGDKSRSFIVSYYSVIAVAINLLLVVMAVWAHSAALTQRWRWVVVAGILLVATAGADFWLKKVYDKRQATAIYEGIVNQLLRAAAVSILQAAKAPKEHIRTHVMLPDPDQKHLKIKYEYGFNAEDQDKNISVDIGTGCAGQAWLHKKLVLCDPTLPNEEGMGPHWGIADEELKKIRKSVKCFMSVPINSAKGELIALLNCDSDNTMTEMHLKDEGLQKVAYSFSQAIGVLLDGMR